MKSFSNPAAEVVNVAAACLILTAPKGKIPKDLSWNSAKKMMANVDQFLKSLISFDKDNTPENCVEKVEADYLSQPNFSPQVIMSKSSAAAGLCSWIINICKYVSVGVDSCRRESPARTTDLFSCSCRHRHVPLTTSLESLPPCSSVSTRWCSPSVKS